MYLNAKITPSVLLLYSCYRETCASAATVVTIRYVRMRVLKKSPPLSSPPPPPPPPHRSLPPPSLPLPCSPSCRSVIADESLNMQRHSRARDPSPSCLPSTWQIGETSWNEERERERETETGAADREESSRRIVNLFDNRLHARSAGMHIVRCTIRIYPR